MPLQQQDVEEAISRMDRGQIMKFIQEVADLKGLPIVAKISEYNISQLEDFLWRNFKNTLKFDPGVKGLLKK